MWIIKLLDDERLYLFMLRCVGLVLCPLSLGGCLAPLTYFAPIYVRQFVSATLFIVACGLFVGNIYLALRRSFLGHGASCFPMFGTIAATFGLICADGLRGVPLAILMLGILDTICIPVIGASLGRVLRLLADRD